MCSSDIFLGFIAILFPPLAVWVKTGLCSADSLINILLCMLGFIPGLLHAWYIIAKYPDETIYESIPTDAEGGRVTYVYVQQGGAPRQGANASLNTNAKKPTGYGTTAPMTAPAVHQQQNGTWSVEPANAGESSSGAPAAAPPSYAQAVKGDHKVQSSD